MKIVALLLCPLLMASACKKKHPVVAATTGTENNQESPGPEVHFDRFPLKKGNMWVYDNGDTIRVAGDTTIKGMAAFKVVKTNKSFVEVSYYTNQSDGFYELGSNSRYYAFEFAEGCFPDTTHTFFDTGILLAKFPTNMKTSWNTNYPKLKNDARLWDSYVTITTPAGTFNCIKMQGGYNTEYYSAKGLARVVTQMVCVVAPCPSVVANLTYVNF